MGEESLYISLANRIEQEIKKGVYRPGEKLKSRRQLAREMGLSVNTVEAAYRRLCEIGIVYSKAKSGYYVSEDTDTKKRNKYDSDIINFSTHGVETSKLPFDSWAKIQRRVIKEDTGLFQHGDKLGETELRSAIMRYLYKRFGISCSATQILIGADSDYLIRSICGVVGKNKGVVFDNYHDYRIRIAVNEIGQEAVYIPNDENGPDCKALWRTESKIYYCMPTHSMPTARTLSLEKRMELLEWASEDRYIIEDSYDNEFCYGKCPDSLFKLSGGKNVIYVGSFSRTLAPSMKIGYAILPEGISQRLVSLEYQNRVSRIEQITLSRFINEGIYLKHVEYMTEIYRQKILCLKESFLNTHLADRIKFIGDDSGMYCNIEFDFKNEESAMKELLTERKIKVTPLTSCIAKYPPSFAENTYIVGVGELKMYRIKEGVERWAAAWKRFSK